jgi:hypothetical protein
LSSFQAVTRRKVSGKSEKENQKLNNNNDNNNPMISKNHFNSLTNNNSNISNYYPQFNNHSQNSNSKTNNQSFEKSFQSNVNFNFANIQTKLKVSQPGDVYEQEADRIAEQVMRMSSISDPIITSNMLQNHERIDRRKCSACKMKEKDEEEEKKNLDISRKSSTISNLETTTDEITNDISNIRSSEATPLDANTRGFMESRFGYDFSNIRIHTDETAAKSAYSVNALAYTVGNDIVFGEGQYKPNSLDGRKLLAHELTHVVQQKGSAGIQRRFGRKQDKPDKAEPYSGILRKENEPCADVKVSQNTIQPQLLQRACGKNQIKEIYCNETASETSKPKGETILFNNDCDTFLTPAERSKVEHFSDSVTESDTVNVHGFPDTKDLEFNPFLPCARAMQAVSVLHERGIPLQNIETIKHIRPACPPKTPWGVVLELVEMIPSVGKRKTRPVKRPMIPQLTAKVDLAPTPGNCGIMDFVIHWEISRKSDAKKGGFVVQEIFNRGKMIDKNGKESVGQGIHYFEAWRVDPDSMSFDKYGNGDTFNLKMPDPAGYNGTDGSVIYEGTARYHDGVSEAEMPKHMVRQDLLPPNLRTTTAGMLLSSTTDPNLDGNISRPVSHRLSWHWTCRSGKPSLSVVDDQVPK